MTTIAVGGVKHAPGATTLAVTLAGLARDGALVVEADPQGGDVAARSGLSLDPGLLTLAAAARRGLTPQLLDAHTQQLASGAAALFAPSSPNHAHAALTGLRASLASLFANRAGVTVIDVGRWDPRSGAIETALSADVALLLFRPTVGGVEHVRTRLELLSGIRTVLVAVGDHPYGASEISDALGGGAVHVIADDQRAAELAGAGAPFDRWLRRTPYIRTVAALLDALTTASARERAS
ncbi:MAG: hypothetical protein AB7W59_27780 [Acidimicrobiia bacterium]